MWWTNSTWLNCLESLQVQAIRVREIFTGVFTFQLPTALESDLLFSHLPGSSLSEGRRAGRYLDRSTRMGENKHSRHQAEAEKDSRFGVICHCIVWHLWGGFTYMYWIHMDTMRTPHTQESEPPPASVSHSPQIFHHTETSLNLSFVSSKKTQCSWRLQQSSPWRLDV